MKEMKNLCTYINYKILLKVEMTCVKTSCIHKLEDDIKMPII